MKQDGRVQWAYRYQLGPAGHTLAILVALASGLVGLVTLINPVAVGLGSGILERGLFSGPPLLCAFLLIRWLRRIDVSSQEIKLFHNKVQLPMTEGVEKEEYLMFDNVQSLELVRDFEDHGPALIVSTISSPVAYKCMYFDSYVEFRDFGHRFESLLKSGRAQPVKSWSVSETAATKRLSEQAGYDFRSWQE